MALVTFENGTKVNFDGMPTPQDIEEVAQKLNLRKDSPATTLPQKPQAFSRQMNSPAPTLSQGASLADTFFGAGKIGEALGTLASKGTFGKTIQKFSTGLSDKDLNNPDVDKSLQSNALPTGRELLGSTAQAGLSFLPVGKAAKGASVGLKALGAGTKLADIGGKSAARGLLGYGYDVASGLSQGEENPYAPGIGTALGAASPFVLPALRLGKNVAKGTAQGGKVVARGAKNIISTPIEAIGNKIAQETAISKLPLAERAVRRAGFDEKSVKFLRDTLRNNRKEYQEMVQLADKGAQDTRFASRNEPKQVIGKAAIQRIDTIQRSSNAARNELNAVAKKPRRIDIMPAIDAFEKRLADRGISRSAQGELVSTGNIPSSELPYYDKIVKEVRQVLGNSTVTTSEKAHRLRQRLFSTLEAEARKGTQPGIRPFSDKVDQDVNVFRSKISEALGPKYQKAAKTFAENESVLRDISKFAGVPNDWEKISSKDLKFGELLFRQLGNASAKPKELFTALDTLAKKRGGAHKNDLLDLADFADSLEELYGISKSRGFEGGIARGVNQGTGISLDIPTSKGDFFVKAIQAATRTRNADKINALKGLVGAK